MREPPERDNPGVTRRQFLAQAGAIAAGATAATTAAAEPSGPAIVPQDDISELTIVEASRRMASGATTAQALTAAYQARIAAIDRAGPMLRAVIEMNPDALSIAAALDAERKAGRVRGPLHGVPILIKDNIGTLDRMSTTAGCLALDGQRPVADATLVRALRDAGAVILGKTNLSEWANFRSSNSVSGWSSRGGQTRNPYALERTPSGSSSGSASAVAAGLCVAAIGSETDGSITSPAACASLAGLKPTLGFVSRTGIIPIAASQDTAGPMARTVADCALLMNAIVRADAADAITKDRAVPLNVDFTALLARRDLKGVRLGFGTQYAGVNEKADAIVDRALGELRGLGAEIVDVELATFGKFDDAEFDVLLFEFQDGLARYFRTQMPDARLKTLRDVIEYNGSNAGTMMPIFGQDILMKALQKGSLAAPAYREALAKCRRMSRREGIDATVRKHRLDAIVALTSPPPWLIDPVNGDSAKGGCTTMPAVAGYPHVTVPAGYAVGLPVGISFFGPAFSDARLLAYANAYELAARVRKPPGAAATTTRS